LLRAGGRRTARRGKARIFSGCDLVDDRLDGGRCRRGPRAGKFLEQSPWHDLLGDDSLQSGMTDKTHVSPHGTAYTTAKRPARLARGIGAVPAEIPGELCCVETGSKSTLP
jgi:hypothetical protein